MERLLQDLSYGARLLLKNKGFTATAVVTLAVCIAANAAVFCIVNSVVLRPLPFPAADRLVAVNNSYPKAGVVRAGNGVPDYFDRLRDVSAFEEQAIYSDQGYTIGSAGDTERVQGKSATPSLFRVLGVRAVRGRTFSEDEAKPGNEKKVVLSYALWQRRFGGRDNVIGRDLRINGVPSTIVGVLPGDFRFPADGDQPEIFVPAAFSDQEKSDERRHSNSYSMFARLRADASLVRAQQQLDAVNKKNLDRFPAFKQMLLDVGFTTHVEPLHDMLIADVRESLLLLWAGAAFVLLIGAVNIANLVLVRATARLKELATRHVLGASPARLARQMLTETVLLTLVGGVLGLLLGYAVLRGLSAFGLERLPRSGDIHMDGTVVLFTLAVSLVLGVFLGIVPVFSIRKSNLNQAFREEGRSSTGGRRARFMRSAFVTAQVAIALVLLVGAGLLLASFQRVLAVNPGFRPANVITARVALPATRYANGGARAAFATRALEGIRALPGVTAASISNSVAFGDSFNASVILAEGYVTQPGESLVAPFNITASDGYFEAMGIPLVRGRLFDRREAQQYTYAVAPGGGRESPVDAQLVVIVDEWLARKFWPNADPIGKRMFRPNSVRDVLGPGPNARYLTVIGVVGAVKYSGLVPPPGANISGAVYFPNAQQPTPNIFFVARTRGEPTAALSAIRKTVASIDPELPIYETLTMDERLDRSLLNRRTPMMLALAFACVALFLAAVGVYGVLAYQVTQRSREIGIRMALGGGLTAIFRLVVDDGVKMVVAGVGIGLAGAFAVSRALQSQLFGVGALDPTVISLVALILALVALVACVVPAMRAARIDPVRALNDL